jgi:hypothetical protein
MMHDDLDIVYRLMVMYSSAQLDRAMSMAAAMPMGATRALNVGQSSVTSG